MAVFYIDSFSFYRGNLLVESRMIREDGGGWKLLGNFGDGIILCLYNLNRLYTPYSKMAIQLFFYVLGWSALFALITPGLCSSRARWPLAPNFCSWATGKSYFLHTNHMLGTLDFRGSELWAPFNFRKSTALSHLQNLNKIFLSNGTSIGGQ